MVFEALLSSNLVEEANELAVEAINQDDNLINKANKVMNQAEEAIKSIIYLIMCLLLNPKTGIPFGYVFYVFSYVMMMEIMGACCQF